MSKRCRRRRTHFAVGRIERATGCSETCSDRRHVSSGFDTHLISIDWRRNRHTRFVWCRRAEGGLMVSGRWKVESLHRITIKRFARSLKRLATPQAWRERKLTILSHATWGQVVSRSKKSWCDCGLLYVAPLSAGSLKSWKTSFYCGLQQNDFKKTGLWFNLLLIIFSFPKTVFLRAYKFCNNKKAEYFNNLWGSLEVRKFFRIEEYSQRTKLEFLPNRGNSNLLCSMKWRVS